MLFRSPRRVRTPAQFIWSASLVVFLLSSWTSRVDIGVRHVLLLIPLVVMAVLQRVSTMLAGKSRAMVAAACAVLVVQASSALAIAPQYLGYFNTFAGGPENGYRRLADTNVDWGQDLPALRATLARLGAKRPLLAYFGGVAPAEYGVFGVEWPGTAQSRAAVDWVAISATYLDGMYLDTDPFAPFRAIPPSDRAGYSILLFAADRADVQRALHEALAREGSE